MSETEALYNRIDGLRKLKGMTVKDLAKEAGVHPNTIYRIPERKTLPKMATLQKISRVLEVSVDWLVGPQKIERRDPDITDQIAVEDQLLVERYNVIPEEERHFFYAPIDDRTDFYERLNAEKKKK